MLDSATLRNLAILLAFSFVCCFLNLGGFPLTSMEPMVIDGARHMLAHGQWAVPHLYGEIFMFKPPLASWLSAIPLALWNDPSELLLRLPFAIVGMTFGLIVFGLFTRAGGPRLGLITALAAIGSVQFTDKVRIAQYQLPLTAGVGLAVAAAVINLSLERPRASLWLLSYFGLGMGFLAKGMPALMVFAPGLLVAAVCTGSVRRLFEWRHLCGWAFGALIIGGYLFWAHATAGPEAFLQAAAEARVQAIGWSAESVARTLAKPAVVWACFLPWSLALFLWRRFRVAATPSQRRMANAAFGFALGGLLAFLIVPTYHARYYLPLVASFAILSAVMLDVLYDQHIGSRFLAASRALFGIAVLLLAAAGVSRGSSSWLLLGAAFALTAVAALSRSSRMHTGGGLVRVMVATSLVCAVGQALVTVPGKAQARDLSEVARRIRPHLASDETLWLVGPADCAARVGNLLHYLDRPVRTLTHPHSTEPGSMILLIEPQSDRLAAGLEYEVVDRAHHPYADLTLIRTGLIDGGPQPPGGRATVGRRVRVGDLCRDKYRQPAPGASAAELDYNLQVSADKGPSSAGRGQ